MRSLRTKAATLAVAAAVGVALSLGSGDARACGGCFHEPGIQAGTQNGEVITDHRMIFSVSPKQTTLYDEIEYAGDPQSFAWVLPIHGPVTVGLSADVLFAALDGLTQTSIVGPTFYCPPAGGSAGAASSSGGTADPTAPPSGTPGVDVISQQVVGPYDTVQLQSSDPNALTSWLQANGYAIPDDVAPVIAAYVSEGFDFLALKLEPGQGVQAMRPVSVTSPGAGLSLPLRMVAAGTGATVGITLWVVGDGRYEPQNFPSFTVDASELTWDWSAQSSDYASIRQQKEAAAGFATWQVESSLDVAPYAVEDLVLQDPAEQDYLAGSNGQAPADVRVQDLETAFPGNPATVRVTRMRADLAHAALATDLVLQASADQSPLPNVLQVTRSVNEPSCPGSARGGGVLGGTFSCSTAGADTATGVAAGLLALMGVAVARARARRRSAP
jgi:MYXO-CTERM domain-containing protein